MIRSRLAGVGSARREVALVTGTAWPCKEPEYPDTLRAKVGIEPFDEYVAEFAVA
ncbi:hypothetical protein [Streptomyces sp. NPDC048295]|uniref:hypothetical protein n=1 Tax=Streptomyces sp. NPDC048295 TaxID=3154617 RepID=UPI00344226ED